MDLFIETKAPMPCWENKPACWPLEDELGLSVDILVKCVHDPDTPFEAMALSHP